MVLIMIYFICTSNYESSKFQVKDMNVYIEPLIHELLKLWNGINMYDVSRPIQQRQFQFHAMAVLLSYLLQQNFSFWQHPNVKVTTQD